MLILTRRPGERVVIGDEILVTVMGVSGHTVRLGIAAPEGVPIYREEIWEAVREENRAAAAAAADVEVDVETLPHAPEPAQPEGQAPAGHAPAGHAPAGHAPADLAPGDPESPGAARP